MAHQENCDLSQNARRATRQGSRAYAPLVPAISANPSGRPSLPYPPPLPDVRPVLGAGGALKPRGRVAVVPLDDQRQVPVTRR